MHYYIWHYMILNSCRNRQHFTVVAAYGESKYGFQILSSDSEAI